MDYLKIVLVVLAIIALCMLGLLMGCEQKGELVHVKFGFTNVGEEYVAHVCPRARTITSEPCECFEEGKP